MLSYKKQKGSGPIHSRFRNSSVHPERNFTYIHDNNSTILPNATILSDESVPIREYTTFRCIWKNNIRRDFLDDYDRTYSPIQLFLLDDYLDIIIDPIDEKEGDWLFDGVTDESIKDEIKEYMKHYRTLLQMSNTDENVFDIYSGQYLSIYDIHKKMFELLKIKQYILNNPIQQAHAEIVPPAESAYIAKGGKKKIIKQKNVKEKEDLKDNKRTFLDISNFLLLPFLQIYF